MMKNTVVTTTLKRTDRLIEEARRIAIELGLRYADRNNKSLEYIKEKYGVSRLLIVSQDRLTLYDEQGEFFFHPSMAKIRIKDIISGKTDLMAAAMKLQPGARVLDCTLGLASDALVSSFITGEPGRVVGLEKVPLIALICAHGLQHYQDSNPKLNAAMRRIEVINTDAMAYLRALPDNAYDVVYFDPMFRRPRLKSSAINAMRTLADPAPLNPETVREAIRVAAKRVVMKESRHSGEFARLGFGEIVGGTYSPIAYGVIKIND